MQIKENRKRIKKEEPKNNNENKLNYFSGCKLLEFRQKFNRKIFNFICLEIV